MQNKYLISTSYQPAVLMPSQPTAYVGLNQNIELTEIENKATQFIELPTSTANEPFYDQTFWLNNNEMIEIEKRLYEEKKDEYLETYEGEYIALQNGEVIDHDCSFSVLAGRVYAKHGYKAIFFPFVSKRTKPFKSITPKFK